MLAVPAFLASSSQPLIGKRNLDPVSIIGKGGFGQVVLCRETVTDHPVAVKVMSKRDLIARGYAHRACTEAMLHARLSSPWCVKLLDSFQDEDHVFLVMEYVPGGDLMSLLLRPEFERLPEDTVQFYAAEIIEAISAVHNENLVHRDIKPDNFLLDAYGHLKLADFGLATSQVHPPAPGEEGGPSSVTSSPASTASWDAAMSPRSASMSPARRMMMSAVGTADYSAPEVIRGRGYSGPACDWWALGVIVFEMLYGFNPFAAGSTQETALRVLHSDRVLRFPRWPLISDEARDFISRLVVSAPEERLGSGEAGVDEIRSHPFLKHMKWGDALRRCRAPFVPKLASLNDTSNFDEFPVPEGRRVLSCGMNCLGDTAPTESAATLSAAAAAVQMKERLQFASAYRLETSGMTPAASQAE